MRRQYLTFLLAMLMSFVSNVVSAHDFAVGGIYYRITSSYNPLEVAVSYRGSNIDSYSNTYRGSVKIPETVTYNGKVYYVTSIDSYAFGGCTGLTSVTIGNSVGVIDEGAFAGCSNLTSATIGNSVRVIGEGAFNECSSLTSITIPESVTEIWQSAFSGCTGLTSVTIGNSVEVIDEWAFAGCSNLTSATIGNSVRVIGEGAFNECSSLTSITIPESVTKIWYSAFDGCSSLTSVKVYWMTPISIPYDCFSNIDNATLFVPVGSKAAYQAADCWSDFKKIEEFSLLATGISLNKTELTLTSTAPTATLTASVVPETAVKTVTWTSSNTSVATVNSNGKVTAVTDGTATITAKTTDGTNLSATCKVTVSLKATGISLDKTSLLFSSIGETATLIATITPNIAAYKGVTWSSNNTSVATVNSSGLVTAKGDGTATITAKTKDGTNLTATCIVTVMTPANATFNGSESKITTTWYADRSMEPRSGLQEMHAVHYQPGNTDRSGDGTTVGNNKVFVFNLLSGFKGGVINATTSDPRDLSKELTIIFNTQKYANGITQVGASGRSYKMTATNDVVSATYNGKTMAVVKLIDSYKNTAGRWTEFQNNDFAKDLLNANPIFNADGTTTDAFYTEMTLADLKNPVPMNITGDIDFRVRYLRPIDITHVHAGKAYLKDGAEAGFDDLYMADIFTFTDWRLIYPFGYNINDLRDYWMDFYGIHEIYFNMDEIETDRDGKIEKLEDPNLSLTLKVPANKTIWSTRDGFRTNIGSTRYQNNGGAVGSYNIFIPYHVVHYWGEVVFRVQVPIVGTFDDETNIRWLDEEEIKATSVQLSQTSLEFDAIGSTAQLTATVLPKNATNRNVTWRSTNVAVATVDNGLVTAVGKGTAQIIATTADGTNKTASCWVEVNVSDVFSNNKLYTLTCKRGGLVMNAEGTGLAAGQKRTDAPEADTRFAIITYEGAQYLYSPVNKQYLLFDGSFVNRLGSPITFDDSKADGEYKFMLSTQGTNDETWYFNNNGNIVINSWDTPDDGNRWLIEAVADFDPTEALALAGKQTCTVTYKVRFNNQVVATATEEVAIGDALPATPASLTNSYITLTNYGTHPSKVTQDVTVQYTATWNGPFEFSKKLASAKWYNMHIRSGYYIGKQENEPYYPDLNAGDLLKTEAYHWAFGGDPYHVKVYNRTTGFTETLAKDGDNVVMRAGDYTWDLLANSDGFVLRETGTSYNCINQFGGTSGPLKFWNNAGSTTDDGSTFRVEEAQPLYDAIETLSSKQPAVDDANLYNLSGQRINRMQRGVIIRRHNGKTKKVLVK